MCESPARNKVLEARQAVMECNGPGRLVGSVSGPAAEFGDDPGCRGEGVAGVGVFLQLGLALEGFGESIDDFDLFGREGEAGGQRIEPVAGRNELDVEW